MFCVAISSNVGVLEKGSCAGVAVLAHAVLVRMSFLAKRKALQHFHCKWKLWVSSRVGLGFCIRTADGLALKEIGI